MKLGGAELLIIVLVMAFVLGPERTVLYARKTGKWLRVLKIYLSSMVEDLKETVVEPLQDIQEPLRDMMKPVDELAKDVEASADGIADALARTPRKAGLSVHGAEDASGGAAEDSGPGKPGPNDPAGLLETAEFIEDAQ